MSRALMARLPFAGIKEERISHLRFVCTAGKFCVLYFMESEAPPSAGWYNFLGWLDVNKKRVAIGVVVVAAIGAVAGLMFWRAGEREVEAGEALSAVKHNP